MDRVADWPGVHSATALIEGTPLVGTWYNRSREYAARQLRREKDVDPEQKLLRTHRIVDLREEVAEAAVPRGEAGCLQEVA